MIPRVFHQVWLGSDAMPEAVLAARQTWIARHPGWEFRIWRSEDLTWLRNRVVFDRAETYAQKADIARYEIVLRFGGVYLDTDMECLRSIDELLSGCQFFAGREADGTIAIGIFGAAPNHPILRQVVTRLPASVYFRRQLPVNIQTGPALLDRVVRHGGWEETTGVRIFPPAYFYPYAWWEPWRRDEAFPRAYALHHWRHSWREGNSLSSKVSELFPRGEALSSTLGGVWQEGKERIVELGDRKITLPAKRFVSNTIRRLLPPPPQTSHGLAWREGEVLVSAPFGARLLCPTDDLSIAPELALTGSYDARFVSFLERHLRRGMTFVDVGANVGLFSILAAIRVGPGGRVFAFECNPVLCGFLSRNIEMNWLHDSVCLIEKAAHRDDEERTFRVPRQLHALGSLTRFSHSADSDPNLHEYRVRCERVDAVLRDLPYIDLMKIDVEGGEGAVIEGASGLLDQGKIGMISMEYRADAAAEDVREETETALISLVRDRGARLLIPGSNREIPLDEALTVFHYPNLLVRFPNSTIVP